MMLSFQIGGYDIVWWWNIFGLVLIPILGLFYFGFIGKKSHPTFRMSGLEAFEGHSLRGILRMYVPPILRLLALSLLVIAFCRPQKIDVQKKVKGEGIDIMLVMDLSSSMLAKDFEPNRMEASKTVAAEFIDKREFDRIGLVAFAGEAFSPCPPTTDYNILKDFLADLRVGIIADKTAIGMGLATSVNRIKENKSENKVIILLTDGVNNTGYYTPLDAANMAKVLGIKVYTIGVGTMGDALAPIRQRVGGEYVFGLIQVEIDEALLMKISNMTGGKYYRATDKEKLQQIYDEINKLETSEIEVTTLETRSEAFHPFVFWALLFLFLELVLKYTVLRSVP